MKIKSIIILMMFCLFIPITAFASSSEEEVVQSFNTLAQNHIDSYQTDKREKIVQAIQGDKKWRKFLHDVSSNYSIDIQKTNSIVTPYIGIFEFEVTIYKSEPFDTEEEARATNTYTNYIGYHKDKFAYQNDTWVTKERIHSIDNKKHYFDCWDKATWVNN